jgi:peptide/nickel transport system permease protein
VTLFVLRRLGAAAGVLLIVSVAVFSLLHLAPGDPVSVLAGPDATPETLVAIRADLGLDKTPVVQYVEWLGQLVRGDLGISYVIRRPVSELIGQRVGSTMQLTVAATFLLLVFGVTMGILLATSRFKTVRRVIDQLATLCLALPPFVSGIILIFLFAVVWGVLPSGGDAPFLDRPGESLRRLILPSIAMALPSAPVVARLLATEMRRVREQ